MVHVVFLTVKTTRSPYWSLLFNLLLDDFSVERDLQKIEKKTINYNSVNCIPFCKGNEVSLYGKSRRRLGVLAILHQDELKDRMICTLIFN